MCQYVKHKTSNIHSEQLKENSMMADLLKGCAKVNLHNPSLLHTLQCILQCMGHVQMCITCTKITPISKRGSWYYTTATINRLDEPTPDIEIQCFGPLSQCGVSATS